MNRLLMLFFVAALTGCSSTYQREHLSQEIKDLAKKEYKLDVDVVERGQTVGVRYGVGDLLGELMAPDQKIWNEIEDLMMVLSRIGLSCDRAPEFVVLDIFSVNNPRVHLVFTRYVKDVQKVMAEGISRTQFLDRLLIEFVIGEEKILFDPNDTDLVRFMMMALDTDPDDVNEKTFEIAEVQFPEFLARVAAKSAQRILRDEHHIEKNFLLREVTGEFNLGAGHMGQFKIFIDLVSRPALGSDLSLIETKILPVVAKEVAAIFKSYRFDGFNSLTVFEKNSGKLLTVSKGF